MSSQVTLKALGLNTSPNNLSLPNGSFTLAENVIVRRDDVIESRRGISDYSQGLGLSTDRIKQLIEYKGRILAHYADKLSYDTLTENADNDTIFNTFFGSYTETEAGLRIKYIEANKNLYFTTGEGIKRMAARTAADFSTSSGLITNAGAIQALDFTAQISQTQGQVSGFLPSDSALLS